MCNTAQPLPSRPQFLLHSLHCERGVLISCDTTGLVIEKVQLNPEMFDSSIIHTEDNMNVKEKSYSRLLSKIIIDNIAITPPP